MFRKVYCVQVAPLLRQYIQRSLRNNSSQTGMASSTESAASLLSTIDTYGGLHLDVSSLGLDAKIEQSVQHEIQSNTDSRTVWIKLGDKHFAWLHRLSKIGFKIHHARNETIVLFKSLQEDSRVPKYSFTNIGVGAVVVNDNEQVLLVKEKHPFKWQMWKFPGGYAEQGEDLHLVAEREVLEETGIKARFESFLLVRHLHKFAFDCADMYFVGILRAESTDIQYCNKEIEFCQWFSIGEILDQLSPFNRLCLENYLKYKDNPVPIVAEQLDTPYLPVPNVTIYAAKY